MTQAVAQSWLVFRLTGHTFDLGVLGIVTWTAPCFVVNAVSYLPMLWMLWVFRPDPWTGSQRRSPRQAGLRASLGESPPGPSRDPASGQASGEACATACGWSGTTGRSGPAS
jgi:hypothetical protein